MDIPSSQSLQSIHLGSDTATRRHHHRRYSDELIDHGARSALPTRRWRPAPTEQASRIGRGVPRIETTSISAASRTTSLYAHDCDSAECAVKRVLETMELLEQILFYQTTHDILELRRVARAWRQTVDESPQLRRHRFVRPQWTWPPTTLIYLPISAMGISTQLGGASEAGQYLTVSLTLPAAIDIAPEYRSSRRRRSLSIFSALRERKRQEREMSARDQPHEPPSTLLTFATETDKLSLGTLFVTQPPLTVMQAFVAPLNEEECAEEPTYSHPLARLSCDAGIKLWFLAETAQMLLEQYRTEPPTPQRVVFRGSIPSGTPESTSRKRSGVQNVVKLSETS